MQSTVVDTVSGKIDIVSRIAYRGRRKEDDMGLELALFAMVLIVCGVAVSLQGS
jgi:hypothetical protein